MFGGIVRYRVGILAGFSCSFCEAPDPSSDSAPPVCNKPGSSAHHQGRRTIVDMLERAAKLIRSRSIPSRPADRSPLAALNRTIAGMQSSIEVLKHTPGNAPPPNSEPPPSPTHATPPL